MIGETFNVEIDGKKDTLTNVYSLQWNTNGNKSAHSFPMPLHTGMRFRTGGHHYVIHEQTAFGDSRPTIKNNL